MSDEFIPTHPEEGGTPQERAHFLSGHGVAVAPAD